jgi:hypothetical protein
VVILFVGDPVWRHAHEDVEMVLSARPARWLNSVTERPSSMVRKRLAGSWSSAGGFHASRASVLLSDLGPPAIWRSRSKFDIGPWS